MPPRGRSHPACVPAARRVAVWQGSDSEEPSSRDDLDDESEDDKGYRIVRTEERVFEHIPAATHFRYPYVYGPYQLQPREWCVVRRILDGRPHIVLPDGGLLLQSYGYTENVAHALLLCIDRPEVSAGQIYNCADAETLTLRQVVEILAESLELLPQRPRPRRVRAPTVWRREGWSDDGT